MINFTPPFAANREQNPINPAVPVSRLLGSIFTTPVSVARILYNKAIGDTHTMHKVKADTDQMWKDTRRSLFDQSDVSNLEHFMSLVDAASLVGTGGALAGARQAGKTAARSMLQSKHASGIAEGLTNKSLKALDSFAVRRAKKNADAQEAVYKRILAESNPKPRAVNAVTQNKKASAKVYADKLSQAQAIADAITRRASGFSKASSTYADRAAKELGKEKTLNRAAAALALPSIAANSVPEDLNPLTDQTITDITNKINNAIPTSANPVEASKMPIEAGGNSTHIILSNALNQGGNGADMQGIEAINKAFPQGFMIKGLLKNTNAPDSNQNLNTSPSYEERILEELNKQQALRDSIAERLNNIPTQNNVNPELTKSINEKISQIRSDTASNPLFWLSNLVATPYKLKRGISPVEAWEQGMEAVIQGDPEYKSALDELETSQRLNPTDLQVLTAQAQLANSSPDDWLRAAILSAKEQNDAIRAKLYQDRNRLTERDLHIRELQLAALDKMREKLLNK